MNSTSWGGNEQRGRLPGDVRGAEEPGTLPPTVKTRKEGNVNILACKTMADL